MSEAREGIGTLGEEAVRLLGAVSEAIAAAEPGRSPGQVPEDGTEATPAAGSWSEELGALAEEAAEAWGSRGVGTAHDDPAHAGRRDPDPDHGPGRHREHAGQRRPEEHEQASRAAPGTCRWCPVCRAVHLLEETHPEVRVHLLSAARSLLRATAAVLEQVPREHGASAPGARPDPGGEATGAPGTDLRTRRGPGRPPAARVEHIPLDDDGPAGLGRTSGPEGRDEENW